MTTRMKILITGPTGKVAAAFMKYIKPYSSYETIGVSMRSEVWRSMNFSEVDVILHCAALNSNVSEEVGYDEFRRVNVTLTQELFVTAINNGVKLFIFMSSADIYNYCGDRPEHSGIISADTMPEPVTFYGKSKLEAEMVLTSLAKECSCRLAIIRPMEVIGENGESTLRGYRKALKLPFFPVMFTDNKRSILYMDTLCALIKMIIDRQSCGVYFPQNYPRLSVHQIIDQIAKCKGRKIRYIPIPKFLWFNNKVTRRYYGNICYTDDASSHFDNAYSTISTYEAITRTIKSIGSNER